jgi:glycosyltransferase involved in cell wall biosynthesis
MVLSEAGAAGLPAIATAVAAMPEVVRDGETGLIVPPGDTGALAAALRTLITNGDLRRRLGTQAHALVTRQYDAEANTRRLLDLLKEVVEAARGAERVTA